jgi:hypothetical protein
MFSGVDDRLRFWLNGHLIDELEVSELVDARPYRPHAMFTVAYKSLDPISSIRLESLCWEAVFHGAFVHSR